MKRWQHISALALSLMTLSAHAQETKTIKLSVTHPGFESKKAEEHEVQMQLDAKGNPQGYSMQVKSVFCSDEKCDVITLQMRWNAIGQFVGYQLPEGTKLTKYDHEPFEKADYAKFEELMKNRGSILADLDIKQLIVEHKDHAKNTKPGIKPKPKDAAGKGDALQKVDAISGATPSYIQEEVVEGAAYTCYTMWHWANGNTAQQIRNYSLEKGSPEWLVGLLESESTDELDFALEAIPKRKLHDATIQAKVIAAAKKSSMESYKILADYLAKANSQPQALYSAYQELMNGADSNRRIYLLEQLQKRSDAPPVSFFEQSSENLADIQNFYELQLFLNLAEKHAIESDQLTASVSKVLANENFFFSRRAYTFLKGRKLPAQLQATLEAYEKKHEGRF